MQVCKVISLQKNCFFCNAKYIFLCFLSYALLIVNKRLHRALVLELRVFERQRLREDGGTTRGNTEEGKFRESGCKRSKGSGEYVSHFKSMRKFLRLLCRHLLEVKHGEGGIHCDPSNGQSKEMSIIITAKLTIF